jgi:xylulokinase
VTEPLTVGIDVGTTSVKAVAVTADGTVVGRTRIPHRVIAPIPDCLEHDARRAWRLGPRRAFATVEAAAAGPIAGVAICSMVPSLTAVDRRGVPLTPGVMYGDYRGHPARLGPRPSGRLPIAANGLMPDAEGFVGWAAQEAPDAAGYWPAQAVAARAIGGVPAIDVSMTAALGALFHDGQWDESLIESLGARLDQMPVVAGLAEPAGTLAGRDTLLAGGTIDAFCDQIVTGASDPGDVMALFGATLIVWIVTDGPAEAPGLHTIPHTVPERFLVGGPSNAGALFLDWVRSVVAGANRRLRPDDPARPEGSPNRVPVWLPYLRGERAPYNDPSLRASLHDLDIGHRPESLRRAAFEASGFIIRRFIELSGLPCRRIVASGGGSASVPWMAAVADVTGLPVDSVAVSEGAALGAAFFARLTAGLASSLGEAESWARAGRRTEPDPAWHAAASARYSRFLELTPPR